MMRDEIAEARRHLDWINSPEGQAAFEARLEEEERMRKSVTEEEAARRYMPPVVLDEVGTPRFRENPLVTAMLKSGARRGDPEDRAFAEELRRMLDPEGGNAVVRWIARSENVGRVDMNEVAEQGFPQEDQELFAMVIGYSVSGAGDLPYFSDAMWERADAEARRVLEEEQG